MSPEELLRFLLGPEPARAPTPRPMKDTVRSRPLRVVEHEPFPGNIPQLFAPEHTPGEAGVYEGQPYIVDKDRSLRRDERRVPPGRGYVPAPLPSYAETALGMMENRPPDPSTAPRSVPVPPDPAPVPADMDLTRLSDEELRRLLLLVEGMRDLDTQARRRWSR